MTAPWLQSLLEEAGVAELVRDTDADGMIAEVDAWLEAQGLRAPPIAEAARADPVRWLGLAQTLASPMTTPMRGVAALLAFGSKLEQLDVAFVAQQRFTIAATVSIARGRARPVHGTNAHRTQTVKVMSEEVWDFDFLRHLATMKLSGRPALHGFYGLS